MSDPLSRISMSGKDYIVTGLPGKFETLAQAIEEAKKLIGRENQERDLLSQPQIDLVDDLDDDEQVTSSPSMGM